MEKLMTHIERRMAREALAQMLAGENDLSEAEYDAARSALAKLMSPDPARKLRELLDTAFRAFAHDDGGAVWSDSLIARVRRTLRATEEQK